MNILFITEDHSVNNYGVTAMLSQLADQLAGARGDANLVIATPAGQAVAQNGGVRVVTLSGGGPGSSGRWFAQIRDLVDRHHIGLIHIHGVWSPATRAGLNASRRLKIPALVSVHGMWEDWFWTRDHPLKILKKQLYVTLILRRAVSKETAFHALNPEESADIRKRFPENRIEILPNAIRMDPQAPVSVNPGKNILFLGRLHPKKGVELLIEAFAQTNPGPEWKLLIAGPEEIPAYVRMLKERVSRNGIAGQVRFCGAVFGPARDELMRNAWIMVLPTYSEGQAMTNLEAAALGVPSLTTTRAGLPDWEAGGGLLIEPRTDLLADGLARACAWSLEERNRRGTRLRQWVTDHYSFQTLAPKWWQLYDSLAPHPHP